MFDEDIFGDYFKQMRKEMEKNFRQLQPLMKELEKIPQTPLTDISEDNEGNLIIKLDVPGVKKDDIELAATPESIEIKAKRQQIKQESKKGYYSVERGSRSFYRALRLPVEIDVNNLKTDYENGVLKIKAPKLKTKKEKKVKIKL